MGSVHEDIFEAGEGRVKIPARQRALRFSEMGRRRSSIGEQKGSFITEDYIDGEEPVLACGLLLIRLMRRVLLILALSLSPIVAFAQPPPKDRAPRPATPQLSILKTALRQLPSRVQPESRKLTTRTRTVRVTARVQSRVRTPSSLHLLGSSLLELPPALHTQPSERPTALRQLQYQLDLLQIRSPH